MREDFNQIVKKIAVSDIRQFDNEVSQVPGMVKLTLGEPDFNTPEHVKQAAIKAIEDNQSHYTPNPGIPALREAAAAYYNEKFNWHYQAENVITTVGATEGIAAALQAIVNPDDVVIIPTPIFPIYIPDTLLNHGQVVFIDTSADGFVLTPERLEATIKAQGDKVVKALVLNYPNNPTGVTYNHEELAGLAKVIAKYQLWVVSDEVYAELSYSEPHESLANFIPEQVIVVNGLSKSHAMTGWRVGFLLAPKAVTDEIIKSHQYMVTAPVTLVQYAALEAMTNGKEDSQVMAKQYVERRDYLIKSLEPLGFEMARPDGAFYLFAKIPANCPQDSWTFVRELAKTQKLALIPGISFGAGGEGYVRISYAASMENLHKAVERLTAFVQAH
ncbi:pyridoxal phosphate-dependent aminotransferase [Loigolactobacillus coryniformis]|uniref:Aminotransferase n=1 Tax=Loigolactobacillus coryniformis subsp. coryniformis CECT 5711 TaxID=1185325 RepID=J3JB68_9LACO|nr:pyridoxal phosphate-dependent aminotransferase [Loigolactobacillus coryniformis]MDT3391570.1 pyridoxal phosphate-dependent aminotransferase [Bacillota bacterium]RRG05242.1 MAG: pyridoxal phosphate-dependent aminotransferase [Lactobacillus sp.]EJN55467.1 Aromatic amino acid aminotransferase [Loigolactobacillus coryniformis subsp. coryniformis CECT 5711]MBW4802804.1 pyridoxal phosphate-dependent aminotransferase [Loigolactobacillus coryniformis subsp. torquens]MBW4805494.1 pyridoxal phosphate